MHMSRHPKDNSSGECNPRCFPFRVFRWAAPSLREMYLGCSFPLVCRQSVDSFILLLIIRKPV